MPIGKNCPLALWIYPYGVPTSILWYINLAYMAASLGPTTPLFLTTRELSKELVWPLPSSEGCGPFHPFSLLLSSCSRVLVMPWLLHDFSIPTLMHVVYACNHSPSLRLDTMDHHGHHLRFFFSLSFLPHGQLSAIRYNSTRPLTRQKASKVYQ